MNKKIVLILILAVVVLGCGAFGYNYFMKEEAKPSVQVLPDGVTVEGTNGGGQFTFCADKCGDGICQLNGSACDDTDFSCICQETKEACPADCK